MSLLRSVFLLTKAQPIGIALAGGLLAWADAIPFGSSMTCGVLALLLLTLNRLQSWTEATALSIGFTTAWMIPQLFWISTLGPPAFGFGMHQIGFALILILLVGGHSSALVAAWCLVCFRRWSWSSSLPAFWMLAEALIDGLLRAFFALAINPVSLARTQLPASPFAQCADVGGATLVSWLTVISACAITDILSFQMNGLQLSGRKRARAALVPMLALVLGGLYGTLRMAPCDTTTGPSALLIPFAWDVGHLDAEKLPSADFAVWPETALTSPIFAGDEMTQSWQRTAAKLACPLVIGCQRVGSSDIGVFNSACLCRPGQNTVLETSDKRFLGPATEMQPPLAKWLEFESHTTNLQAGKSQAWIIGTTVIGVGICHDATFPEWAKDLACAKPDILLLIANESFSTSQQMRAQTLASSRFRAIETRRSLLRCSLQGYSCLIDHRGQTLPGNRANALGIIFFPAIPISTGSTAYHQTNGWLAPLFATILAVASKLTGHSALET